MDADMLKERDFLRRVLQALHTPPYALSRTKAIILLQDRIAEIDEEEKRFQP